MRPTASRIALLGRCQYWARWDVRPAEVPGSEAMDRGKRIHAAVEAYLNGATPLPLEDADEQRDVEAWARWWRANAALQLRPEIALGLLSTRAVIELGRGREAYGKAPRGTRFTGTADAIGDRLVIDWKFGRHADLTTADRHPQLAVLAALAARAYGWDEVEVRLVHVHEGSVTESRATLYAFDLDARADRLGELLGLVATATPRPGDHCGDCPARHVCPALEKALAVRPTADLIERLKTAPADEVLEFWSKLATAKQLIEDAQRAIRERANSGEGLVGTTQRLRESTRERVATTSPGWGEAEAFLDEHGLGGAVTRETKATCSKASIERAIEAARAAGRTVPDVETVLNELRRVGATREEPGGFRLVNLRAHERGKRVLDATPTDDSAAFARLETT